MNENKHIPVMLAQAVAALQVEPERWYVDATFGKGGHTREIINQKGRVIAFDYDKTNIQEGKQAFKEEVEHNQLLLINDNFDSLAQIIAGLQREQQISTIAGVLFDFGTTVEQLTDTERGLSFQDTQPHELDMRLDERLGVTAKDLLAALSQQQLQRMFSEFGGEREAKRISQAVVAQREAGTPVTTTTELIELIEQTKKHKPHHIHPATKVFQALRIAVNDELHNIERALPQALDILTPGGHIVTIAFHEGEDRLCKHLMRDWEQNNLGKQTPKGIITPSETELQTNPRSRSAKLRIFTKTQHSLESTT